MANAFLWIVAGSNQMRQMCQEGLGMAAERALLYEVAKAVRTFIEPVWHEWHEAWGGESPAIASRYTCGRSSLFLTTVLRDEGVAADWMSGTPRFSEDGTEHGEFGFFANDRWESHAWVQSCGWIIDITADQFGADPVIVVPFGDHRYQAGREDTALPGNLANRQKAVDDLLPSWIAHAAKFQ